MLQLKGKELEKIRFQVIQADWQNKLAPIELLDIDDPQFRFSYRQLYPLIYEETLNPYLMAEVDTLRDFLLEWLPKQPRNF
jgi:hypothetical protein